MKERKAESVPRGAVNQIELSLFWPIWPPLANFRLLVVYRKPLARRTRAHTNTHTHSQVHVCPCWQASAGGLAIGHSSMQVTFLPLLCFGITLTVSGGAGWHRPGHRHHHRYRRRPTNSLAISPKLKLCDLGVAALHNSVIVGVVGGGGQLRLSLTF